MDLNGKTVVMLLACANYVTILQRNITKGNNLNTAETVIDSSENVGFCINEKTKLMPPITSRRVMNLKVNSNVLCHGQHF